MKLRKPGLSSGMLSFEVRKKRQTVMWRKPRAGAEGMETGLHASASHAREERMAMVHWATSGKAQECSFHTTMPTGTGQGRRSQPFSYIPQPP